MRSIYGRGPYGYVPWGAALGAAAEDVVFPVAPVQDSSGVARRPAYIVRVRSTTFDPALFSLLSFGQWLVQGGAVTSGWSFWWDKIGDYYYVNVTPNGLPAVAKLPPSTTVSARAFYGEESVIWNFTTRTQMSVVSLHQFDHNKFQLVFSEPLQIADTTFDPSNYVFENVLGTGATAQVKRVQTPFTGPLPSNPAATVLLVMSSPTMQQRLYNFRMTNVANTLGEEVEQ